MKRIVNLALSFLLGMYFVESAGAISYTLFDGVINVNGSITNLVNDPIPEYIDTTGFDFDSGLGNVTAYDPDFFGLTDGYVGFFVDHEIDFDINGFDNEFGSTDGSPGAGQSWEIDEPGGIRVWRHLR